MKIETKVAWPKDHPWNRQLVRSLKQGRAIRHAALGQAVGDRDGCVRFDPHASQPLKKENFVLFHYSVFLERADGAIAVFHRPSEEQGQQRITEGPSILLSHSNPDPPFHAVPRILAEELCVGGRMRIHDIEPVGVAWNQVPPRDGRPKPTYVLAIYRHHFPAGLPLHGRFKDSPDRFRRWHPKAELPELLTRSGYLDQVIGHQLAAGAFTPVVEGKDAVVFAPASRIVGSRRDGARGRPQAVAADEFEQLEYSPGFHVFVSHAAEDSFAAYALYRFLIDESSRRILARIDLEDLKDGERLAMIEPMIRECDGLVLLITPNLVAKARRKQQNCEHDWVRDEVEIAKAAGKTSIGFQLGTEERPYYLDQDIIVNGKGDYPNWLNEVRSLVALVREKFGRKRS